MDQILDKAGIPILIFVVCLYYGLRLRLTHDASMIRGKDAAPLKDEVGYCNAASLLIIALGMSTVVMAGLLFINTYVAVAEIIVATLVIFVLWKIMHDKYA